MKIIALSIILSFLSMASYAERIKHVLEQYEVCDLIRPTISKLADEVYVMSVSLPGNTTFLHVIEGDYIGINHGEIISIGPNDFTIVEVVSNNTGGWVERETTYNTGKEFIKQCQKNTTSQSTPGSKLPRTSTA